jgi:hypothetical protein
MIEFEEEDKFIDGVKAFFKTIFDVIRNSLIVASIGYFYDKTSSTSLLIIYIIVQLLFGMYVASLFFSIRFARRFFSDNMSGKIFRLVSSGILAFAISVIVNMNLSTLIREAIKTSDKFAKPQSYFDPVGGASKLYQRVPVTEAVAALLIEIFDVPHHTEMALA